MPSDPLSVLDSVLPPTFSPSYGAELASQKVPCLLTNPGPVKGYSGSIMTKDMFLRKTTGSLEKKVVVNSRKKTTLSLNIENCDW